MILYLGGALIAGWLFVLTADLLVELKTNRHQCSLSETGDVLKSAKDATDRVDEMMKQLGAHT